MEKQIISMVPEADPRYLEIRQESLRNAKHRFWGQDQVKGYESDLKMGKVERYTNTIVALEEDIAHIDAELAQSGDNDVKLAQLERAKKSKKSELQYFKRALHKAQHLFHELFGDLIGTVMTQEVGSPDGEGTRFLQQELGGMFSTPETREELKRYLGENLESFTVKGLYFKITDLETEIPADFLYRVLKNHHEEMRARAEHVEKMVEDLKEEFFSLIKTEIEQGRLPLEVETVKQRLALVVGRIVDRLDAPTSNTSAMHSADGLIQIYSSELGEEQFDALRATIFHELIHELAGKSIQLVTEKGFDEKEHSKVRDRKTGIQIAAESDSIVTNRFVWLNEAITEWYAQKLSKYQVKGEFEEFAYKGSIAYISERKELDRLFEKGLTEEVVLAAYFEDIHDEQPKGERGTAFATLLKTINALEEDRYAFAKLENQFAMKGAKSYLRSKGIFPAKRVDEELRSELPSGERLYPITFSVGIQQATRVSETFYYMVPPDAEKTEKLLGADWYTKKMESALFEAKILSGGERCKYVIWDPEVIE